ncbi:uncharacterized protein (TIGR00255 family) [Hypnocyclicus thermotrophus]|uniref:Uncharacterized protein (TIGR00255 family) n=1 Tax=Hypnocyclicus thermotrophus TaxID=1627895 RepID=A0AA46I4Y3_9FUSO|nr:YicC/YloC family endoribonuclease [Hypnocyclicus thermotrophus]TDT67922.1 uncharacterized protein (TIGR00255 family) [Hypnocyclicus thermotrophus]
MRSMTGYSKIIEENEHFRISIEMKSVNNKGLNIKIKIPNFLNFLENRIKTEIGKKIHRGYIELKINFEDKRENENLYYYNRNNALSYMKILNEIEKEFSLKLENKVDMVVKYSNSINKQDIEINENEYTEFIMPVLNKVIDNINEMKQTEGERLKEYFIDLIENIKNNIKDISYLKENVVENYKNRLLEKLNNYKNEIDVKEEDILKEILIFTDRSDISEEYSRLISHLEQFLIELDSKHNYIGKKLDFILQEIFRELNTMGVKSNYYDISKLVVDCKSEVEKIREQVMNIE